MMHDMSLTEKHVVFYDLPVTFDTQQAATMTVPRGLRLPARMHVVGVDRPRPHSGPGVAPAAKWYRTTDVSRTRGTQVSRQDRSDAARRGTTPTSAGSTSNRATSSTR
jgi:carotenoid cleavage dioxygenase-like enzyme